MFSKAPGLAVVLFATAALGGDQPTAMPIAKGQHVYITGNSFQVFVDHHLK